MSGANFEAARAYALNRLTRELDPALTYHCVAHTRDEVAEVSAQYAASYDLSAEELLLLKTAACFHDLGFIECRDGHELVSARMAREALPDFGYSEAQIEAICRIIMATHLPQKPESLLGQIIADADLDVFGREDFLPRNQALRTELEAFGVRMDDVKWYAGQLKFAREHFYFTEAARRKNDARKKANIELLERLYHEAAQD